jgi:glutathione synthase/RimK-type ligase-like ATP-grasp enzyme
VESAPRTYHLALAWNWLYDEDFIRLIEELAHARRLTSFVIQQHNLDETLELLQKRKLEFRFVLDRASDEDERFQPLAHLLARRALSTDTSPPIRIINPYDLLKRAADKATMHLEFLSHGIEVPYTIIISPYAYKREIELSLTELARLGRPFIMKPATTTGGGTGVVLGAESLKDIIETRQHHKNDKYLLQEKVRPAYLADNRAWFRVFYAFGSVALCWWDDQTHAYEQILPEDEETFGLGSLRSIARRIQEVCRLDFFSTEIVYTHDQKYLVVDYVNEMCDMRPQSRFPDGVPDTVVRTIVTSLVDLVHKSVQPEGTA